MTCDLSFARQVYQSLPDYLKSPCHDPDYVALDAKEKGNVNAVYFIFQKGGETFYHPFHRVYTRALDVTDFESARGYGGPISTSYDKQFLDEAFDEYQKLSFEYNVLVEFIRFSPIIANHQYYYGSTWLDRMTCAINLVDYDIEKNSHGAILNINKALKNNCHVKITREPTIAQCAAFSRVYNDRMRALNAGKQYIYSEEYVETLIANGNELVLIERNDEVLAGAIFLRSAGWSEYHLSAANSEGQKFGATSLLLHSYAMLNRNGSAIHLGGGTDHKPDNNLLKFKRAMGKMEKSFYIGKYIHQPDRYQKIKMEYQCENNRVTFYR